MSKFGGVFASSTTNRGVEAKEIEIANTRLDRNATESSSSLRDSSAPTELVADASDSFVQVVVHKHRRARTAGATQTSPRLPAASSPIRQNHTTGETAGAGDGNVLLLPASVLLACQSQQPSLPQYKFIYRGTGEGAVEAVDARGDSELQPVQAQSHEKAPKNYGWKILNNVPPDKHELNENVPERVEVYYFERAAGAYLATSGARRGGRVEAARARASRAAGEWLAEVHAAAHLLLTLPVALIISVERCVLTAARDLVTGAVQTAADYALKPALALAFNALLQPPLVFCANVARALQEVVHPLWQLLGDALEPCARALGALRLVHVRVDSRAGPAACRCGRDLV